MPVLENFPNLKEVIIDFDWGNKKNIDSSALKYSADSNTHTFTESPKDKVEKLTETVKELYQMH